jgi:UDP-N-acetylmuramoyl-L-alanyl-D-glutamate--2,6-diaminopimelate ligase
LGNPRLEEIHPAIPFRLRFVLVVFDILLTDDNPRTESPQAIVADIAAGIPAGRAFRVEHDRGRAIVESLAAAALDDIVLIAGKGHEDYQIYGHDKRAFSDSQVVTATLGARAVGAA